MKTETGHALFRVFARRHAMHQLFFAESESKERGWRLPLLLLLLLLHPHDEDAGASRERRLGILWEDRLDHSLHACLEWQQAASGGKS